MSADLTGRVLSVSTVPLGDVLVQSAPVGSTSLVIDDAADFPETGGSLIHVESGDLIAFSAVDDETGTITLSAPTTRAYAADDRVSLWDTERAQVAVETTAQVEVEGTAQGGDPLEAIVEHTLIPYLPDGFRLTQGEAVGLVWRGDDLYVANVAGVAPLLDGAVIAPDTVTARQLSADAIDGKTITGATIIGGVISTGVAGERAVLSHDDVYGGVQMEFYAGSTLTGAVRSWLTGAAPGTRISGSQQVILAVDGDTTNTTYIGLLNGPAPSVTLRSKNGLDYTASGAYGHRFNGPMFLMGTDNFTAGSGTGDATVIADKLQTRNPGSTTSAANVRLGSSGVLQQVSSLSRNKVDQEPLSLDEARGLLDVTAKTWHDRAEVEENGGSTEGLRRVLGVIAEDVEAHAPSLALYHDDGSLQGVAYDRIGAALLPLIREQERRIRDLEERLARLS